MLDPFEYHLLEVTTKHGLELLKEFSWNSIMAHAFSSTIDLIVAPNSRCVISCERMSFIASVNTMGKFSNTSLNASLLMSYVYRSHDKLCQDPL